MWPPMEAASVREAYTAVSRYCLKVTSLLVILGIGDYDWGRCHVSVRLHPGATGWETCFALFTFPYWSFFVLQIQSFMVKGASIDVLWSAIQTESTHTHIHTQKRAKRCLIHFSCQENNRFLLQRRCRSYDMQAPPPHPPRVWELSLVLSGSLMNRTL